MIIEIFNRVTGERCNVYTDDDLFVEYAAALEGLFVIMRRGSEPDIVATYSLNMFGFAEHNEG